MTRILWPGMHVLLTYTFRPVTSRCRSGHTLEGDAGNIKAGQSIVTAFS